MDFAPIIADVKAAKCAGFRYQRAGHQRYRDRVTVYRDGRLLFEPHQLTGAGQGGLVFDGRPARWECVDKLKNDKANGYGGPVNFFKNLFGGRK